MIPWLWTPLVRLTSQDFERSEDLIVEDKKLSKDELLIKLREARVRCIKYQETLKRLEADKQSLEKEKTLLTAELRSRMDGSTKPHQAAEDSSKQVTNQRTEADEQLILLSEEKQALQQEVNSLKEEVKKLKAAEGKERSADLLHKDEAMKLQTEIEQLEWAQTRTERDRVKKDYEQMMTDHNQLIRSHDQLKVEITRLQEQNSQMALVGDQLRKEKDELLSQSQSSNVDQMKDKHVQLQNSFSQLSVELVQLQEKNTQLESLHKQSAAERKEMKQICSEKTEQLDKMKLEHGQLGESLRLELAQLQEENTQVKLSQEKERDQLSKDHDQMKETIASFDLIKTERDNLTSHCAQLKLKLTQLQVDNTQMKEEIENLKEELKNYKTVQNKEIQLNEQLSQSNSHRIKLQKELSVSQQSHSTTLSLVERKAIQVKAIELENKKLEIKLQEVQEQYLVLQKKYKKLQSEHKMSKDRKHEILRTSSLLDQPPTKRRLFLAKHDYNSQSSMFGRSGCEELQLKSGDMVTVLGDVSTSGYYSVEFRSQFGLVHQSVVEEMDISHKRLSADQTDTASVGSAALADKTTHHKSLLTVKEYNYGPLPPVKLKIEAVTLSKASLSWKIPFISVVGLSNGYKVEGYQLYVDDSLHTRVKGCYECKGTVEGVDFSQPHKLSVAAYSIDGLRSNKCEVHYTPQEGTSSTEVTDMTSYKSPHTAEVNITPATTKLHKQGRHSTLNHLSIKYF